MVTISETRHSTVDTDQEHGSDTGHSSDSSPSPDQSIVSCDPVCPDTSSDDNNSESETCSDNNYDFINKPYEEWTQEDYARYYGDC